MLQKYFNVSYQPEKWHAVGIAIGWARGRGPDLMIPLLSHSRNAGSARIWQKGRMCTRLPATLWSTDVLCWSWAWAPSSRSCRSAGRTGSSSSLPLLPRRASGSWQGGLCWLYTTVNSALLLLELIKQPQLSSQNYCRVFLEENFCWEQCYASVENSDFSEFSLAMLTQPEEFYSVWIPIKFQSWA